jgi:hypothetical protein
MMKRMPPLSICIRGSIRGTVVRSKWERAARSVGSRTHVEQLQGGEVGPIADLQADTKGMSQMTDHTRKKRM